MGQAWLYGVPIGVTIALLVMSHRSVRFWERRFTHLLGWTDRHHLTHPPR